MRTLISLFLLLAVLSVGMVPVAAQGEFTASYIFVNLATDVDFYINDEIAYEDLSAPTSNSERFRIPGDFTFTLTAPNESESLATLDLTLAENSRTLIIAAHDADGNITLHAYEPDARPLPVNLGRLQVIDLGWSLPELTIVGQNGDVLAEGVAAGDVTSVDIPGGNYQITIQNADGEQLGATGINANTGNLATLIVYGEDTARTVQIGQVLETQSVIRFVHAARITGPVDVYFDDALVFTDIAYRDATPYTPMPSGNYAVSVFPAETNPDSEKPLWSGNISLGSFPLTAVGLGELPIFRVVTAVDDLQQIPAGTARIRLINAAMNTPVVTVSDDQNTYFIGSLEYGLASRNSNESVGERIFTLREPNGDEVYYTMEGFQLEEFHTYTLVVVGNLIVNGIELLPLDWYWNTPPEEAE